MAHPAASNPERRFMKPSVALLSTSAFLLERPVRGRTRGDRGRPRDRRRRRPRTPEYGRRGRRRANRRHWRALRDSRRGESHRAAGPDADARLHQLPRTPADVRRRLPERAPPGLLRVQGADGTRRAPAPAPRGMDDRASDGRRGRPLCQPGHPQDGRQRCIRRAPPDGRRPLPFHHRRRRRRQLFLARAACDCRWTGRGWPRGDP